MALIDKLNEFKTSLDDCKTALKNKGVTVSKCTADVVASNINSIATTKSMGTKTVTFTQNAIIYGVTITESESDPEKRVTYTDNAKGMLPVRMEWYENSAAYKTTNYNQWKDSWIFDKIYPVMLKSNGTIDYRIDPDDVRYKYGTDKKVESDFKNESYDGNAMVCVEKFYTKFSMSGSNEVMQIADNKQTGFEAIGFIREDGSEADRIFLPMYGGWIDSDGKLRSIGNKQLRTNTTIDDFRTAAQKNGAGYDIESRAMFQMMQVIYFVLMKSCNFHGVLGDGVMYDKNNSLSVGIDMGGYGAIAAQKNGYSDHLSKFMYINNFSTNNIFFMQNGSLTYNRKLYIKMKPPYSTTSTSGYSVVSDCPYYSTVWISKMKCSNAYGRYPIGVLGSDSTYETSNWAFGVGMDYCYTFKVGSYGGVAGGLHDTGSASTINSARLTYLPPK